MQQSQTIADRQPDRMIERYAAESPPVALLITCTDTILDSRLLAQFRSEPLIVWRSTGPVVPPYGSGDLEAEHVVDLAVTELGAKEIAICGHVPSRPLQSLIAGKASREEPDEPDRYFYADAARRIVQEKYGPLDPDRLLGAVAEENVLLQMANLRTYPAVLAGLAGGHLALHSWLYDAEEDELYGYGSSQSVFLSRFKRFTQAEQPPLPCLDPCDIYLA